MKICDEILSRNFVLLPYPEGIESAQILDGLWYAPKWGCDTLQSLVEDLQEIIYGEELPGGHGHGKCKKVEHGDGGGYLHSGSDDGPYDVDGAAYCGRCHLWL